MNNQEISWEDHLYQETFEATLRAVEFNRKTNPDFTIQDLRNQLEAMYIREGNNYGGRGMVGDIDLAASIAALQCALSDWIQAESSAS